MKTLIAESLVRQCIGASLAMLEATLLLVLIILAKLAGVKTMVGVAEWVEFRSE